MIIISDTSPITNLAAIGKLDLLNLLYGSITKEGRELESHAFLKARTQSERAILIARKKRLSFFNFQCLCVIMTSTTLGRRESNISGETDLCLNEETQASKPTRALEKV